MTWAQLFLLGSFIYGASALDIGTRKWAEGALLFVAFFAAMIELAVWASAQ